MPFQQLFVLAEGPDDERFVKTILESHLKKCYDWIRYYQFSRQTPRKVRDLLKSLGRMSYTDYVYLSDVNRSPCVRVRKDKIGTRYSPVIDLERVIIVVAEIESWYLAGLNDDACNALGLQILARTDDITKEDFDKLRPTGFNSRIDFMVEVLKKYSIDVARVKNQSFDYFMRRILAI